MNKAIKIALAGMFAASSLGGLAVAQTATPMTPDSTTTGSIAVDDNVTVVQLSSLNDSDDRGEYDRLSQIANDPAQVQQAQAEVSADANLAAVLQSKNVQLQNVIQVQTAANGGKIVYVR
ncbi:hypothetical protein M8R20_16375 [Pseudomonas sp. R2.Fl]|nr:hypothetical protein [Pseudomonas sp. R2.Fl]